MNRVPDPAIVLAYLEPDERLVIARWLDELGIAPGAWPAVSPLRVLLPLIATQRAAADLAAEQGKPDSSEEAFRAGAYLLGIEGAPESRPGDSGLRLRRNWRAAGKNFRASSGDGS